MSKKLHATLQEINRAFRAHARFYRETKEIAVPATSRRLVLFYAIECGLKARIMRDKKLASTDRLEQALGLHHGLARYAKEARLSAHVMQQNERVLSQWKAAKQAACRPNQPVPPDQYHEAFRYGIELADEPDLERQLERVLDVLGAN